MSCWSSEPCAVPASGCDDNRWHSSCWKNILNLKRQSMFFAHLPVKTRSPQSFSYFQIINLIRWRMQKMFWMPQLPTLPTSLKHLQSPAGRTPEGWIRRNYCDWRWQLTTEEDTEYRKPYWKGREAWGLMKPHHSKNSKWMINNGRLCIWKAEIKDISFSVFLDHGADVSCCIAWELLKVFSGGFSNHICSPHLQFGFFF